MFEQKSLDKIDGDYFNIIIADKTIWNSAVKFFKKSIVNA